MKYILTSLLFILVTFQSSAQNYDPIEFGHKKSFIKIPTLDTLFSFAIETKTNVGADKLFKQFNCIPLMYDLTEIEFHSS